MKWMKAGLISTVLVAAVVLGLIAAGVISLPGQTEAARPPCNELPNSKQVNDALAQHKSVVKDIEASGPGVSVSVANPCQDQTDRALLSITYRTDTERGAVEAVLQRGELGIPAVLVKD